MAIIIIFFLNEVSEILNMSFSLDTENSHKLTFGEIHWLTNDIKPYGFSLI